MDKLTKSPFYISEKESLLVSRYLIEDEDEESKV